MSKSAKPVGTKGQAGAEAAPANSAVPVFKPPLKRRPGVFYALLAALVVWVGILLTMYFVTVYPHRNRLPAVERAAQPEGTVKR